MRAGSAPVRRDIVLVGGGHSHVIVLKQFAMRPELGVRLTLISRDINAPYSGMLPGLVAGHYRFDEVHIDLPRLAAYAGARFYHASAVGVDWEQRAVRCDGRPPVAFDLLSIDIGSTPVSAGVPGVAEHALAVKPVDRFLAAWQGLQQRIAAAPERPWSIAVVGGGAGGVEVLLAMQHRLSQELGAAVAQAPIAWHLISASEQVLVGHHRRVQERYRRVLMARGVQLHLGQRAEAVSASALQLDGGDLAADAVVWVTGAQAAPWLQETGLALDPKGFIRVDQTLQSLSHQGVFAAGDIATIEGYPRPKAGVFAVRQGPVLAANLRRAARQQPLKRHRPQRLFLSLISTGDRYAVASYGALALAGRWVWRWKDAIDRRFMARFQQLPTMAAAGEEEEPQSAAMRCAGCGSKVGADLLYAVLARLDGETPVGLVQRDDAAVLPPQTDKHYRLQTVDGFRAMVDDPYRFGRILSHHALSDIYAMGGEPRTALCLVQLPIGPVAVQKRELLALLQGVAAVLAVAIAVIVGGHTVVGESLFAALTIEGSVDPAQLCTKGGLQPGQRLILTKPLGTGTLLAAAMRNRAQGEWLAAALECMDHSNAAAARLLLAHGATAITDVTGFGLLGHLTEMLAATPPPAEAALGARLELAALPRLPGVERCLQAGIESTLAPANRRHTAAWFDAEGLPPWPYGLLFDPQTSGGLLASMPPDEAAAALTALTHGGYRAAIIGEVTASGRVECAAAEPALRQQETIAHDA